MLNVLGFRAAQMGYAFVASVLIARQLGPEGKGVLNVLFAFIATSCLAFSFGLANSLIYHGRRGNYGLGRLFSWSLFWVSALALLYLPGASFFYWVFRDSFMKGVGYPWFFAAILLFPLFLLNMVSGSLAKAAGKVSLAAAVVCAKETLYMLLLVLSLYVFGKGAGGIIISRIISDLAGFILMLYVIKEELKAQDLVPAYDPAMNRVLFGFGLKSYAGGIFQPNVNRADIFLTNYFTGPAGVGIYSVGLTLAEAALLIPSVVNFVLFPKVSSGDRAAGALYTVSSARRVFWGMAGLGVLVCAASPWFIPLAFGRAFSPALAAVLIIMPGAVLLGPGMLIGAFFEGTGRPEITMKSNILAFCLCVGLGAALLPAFGFAGAAAGLSAGYCVSALFLLYFFQKETGVRWSRLFEFRAGDFSPRAILKEAGIGAGGARTAER